MLFHTGTVARWAAAFQRGRVASADMRRTRHPRTVRTDVARSAIALQDDRRWSLQELQARTNIDQVIVHKILREDQRMRRLILLQSRCHLHFLNNKNGVAMKLLVFIWKYIKMKERTF